MHISPIAGLAEAISLAAIAHNGQVDKAGVPYIAHPLRMVTRALECGMHHEVAIVAALHDIAEDTPVSHGRLVHMGFSERVANAVRALTKASDVSYEAYLRTVAKNPLARAVKVLDVDDNSDPARLARLDSVERDRLIKKYAVARSILKSEA